MVGTDRCSVQIKCFLLNVHRSKNCAYKIGEHGFRCNTPDPNRCTNSFAVLRVQFFAVLILHLLRYHFFLNHSNPFFPSIFNVFLRNKKKETIVATFFYCSTFIRSNLLFLFSEKGRRKTTAAIHLFFPLFFYFIFVSTLFLALKNCAMGFENKTSCVFLMDNQNWEKKVSGKVFQILMLNGSPSFFVIEKFDVFFFFFCKNKIVRFCIVFSSSSIESTFFLIIVDLKL